MKLTSLLEVLWASTLTYRVISRFPARGGLFLIAPPGHLKTSFLSILETQGGVWGYTDMVSNDLSAARDQICSNKIQTMLFYDFQKLFERRQDTASNIIGNLRALTDEGFSMTTADRQNSGGRDPIQRKARALVLGAMTPSCYREHLGDWTKNGFARRFLFCVYQLKYPEIIVSSILKDQPLKFTLRGLKIAANEEIPLAVNSSDEIFLKSCLKYQVGDEVPLILLKKVLSVLRWRSKLLGMRDDSMELMLDFRECLGKEGADLIL